MTTKRGHEPQSDQERAAQALRQSLAFLADELHAAIDNGLDAETLHNIVGLWAQPPRVAPGGRRLAVRSRADVT